MNKLFFTIVVACSSFLIAQEQETTQTHRVLQFENETVKVWKTTIYPDQGLKMHRHENDRIVVGLKGGTLKKIEQSGEISDLIFETGQAYWLEKDPVNTLHADINESHDPIEVMVIEFK